MSIVCGTDFSESSSRAVMAAVHLAAQMKMPLHLVHSLELGCEEVFDECRKSVTSLAESHLRCEAERLRKLGIQVEIHVKAGLPDDIVLEVATQVSAKLIVLGSTGRRQGKTSLGSHADRIAQRAHVPALVVRNPEPFDHWVRGSKPLRILLGADFSKSSEIALRWINELRSFGPCDVVAVHLYWPPQQFHRLGLGGVRNYIDPDPEVTQTLERDFSERMPQLAGSGAVKYRFEPHLGRVGDRLADLAAEEKVDLVVVGSHSRNAVARLWEGSVSRGVLQHARASVACVPAPVTAQPSAAHRIGSVLVATDFSATGDAAIPLAYSVLDDGGTVHLVHIIKASHDPIEPHDIFTAPASEGKSVAHAVARDRLLKEIPSDAMANAKITQVHVLESNDPAKAICQAAERLGVDILCLGTHGRSGITKVFLGSVAQSVLASSKHPVLFARAPTE